MAGPIRNDGKRRASMLACPWCSVFGPGGHVVLMSRHLIERKMPAMGKGEPPIAEQIQGPQARFICAICGLGEVYIRAHKEHREAEGSAD